MAYKTHTLCFSPTQTGATIAQAVQRGFDAERGDNIDITIWPGTYPFGETDCVIITMPVYAGRLAPIAVERFKNCTGYNTPAVAIVVYGNRAYEDALLELTDLCAEQGFQVIAAAAFIGEHSFSTRQHPIAAGRPDAADFKKAQQLGSLVQKKLNAGGTFPPVNVPGNRPYKPGMTPEGAATCVIPDSCARCGLCNTFCPAGAITITEDGPQTDPSKCTWCSACLKACPSHAREFALPKIDEVAERLHANCQTRREPEWFPAQPQETT